jgi:DNA-binding NarL/FixJ family response regulator
MKKIAFLEDHPITLDNLNKIFSRENGFDILFSAETKENLFFELSKVEKPDIIIVDVIVSDVNGLEIFETLQSQFHNIKVIAFTSISSPILVESLLALNIKGYVNKNQKVDDLLQAVNLVSDDEIYLPKDYQFLLKYKQFNIQTLTPREIETVKYIIQEYTINDIAELFNISKGTVENHRKSIFKKLNVKNVAGMVREAIKLGLDN